MKVVVPVTRYCFEWDELEQCTNLDLNAYAGEPICRGHVEYYEQEAYGHEDELLIPVKNEDGTITFHQFN